MNGPEPLDQYLARTEAATPKQYPAARCSRAQFERMKAHVLEIYRGVHAAGSFADDAGHPVDCIPFEDQPSVRAARAAGQAIQVVPPPRALMPGSGSPSGTAPTPARCPDGTVPFPRVLLDDLVRYRTLEDYLRRGSKQPPPRG